MSAAQTVGVLGGGQLARMLALAGAPIGARFRVVDQSADACASQVAPLLLADYTDFDALERFAECTLLVWYPQVGLREAAQLPQRRRPRGRPA